MHEGEGIWRKLGHVIHKVVAERRHNAFDRGQHFGHRGRVVARLRRAPAVCDGKSSIVQVYGCNTSIVHTRPVYCIQYVYSTLVVYEYVSTC